MVMLLLIQFKDEFVSSYKKTHAEQFPPSSNKSQLSLETVTVQINFVVVVVVVET